MFDVEEFERSLLQGRAVILLGYTTLFGLQGLALALFIVGPAFEALRTLV